jgi:hypothetical protein
MRRKRSAPALPTAVESLHAVFLQAVAKIAEMLFVSRFHRAEDMDGGNIGTGKSAAVHDLFNASAGGSNLRL